MTRLTTFLSNFPTLWVKSIGLSQSLMLLWWQNSEGTIDEINSSCVRTSKSNKHRRDVKVDDWPYHFDEHPCEAARAWCLVEAEVLDDRLHLLIGNMVPSREISSEGRASM